MTAVEDEFDQSTKLEPRPWSWARLGGVAVTMVGNFLKDAATACDEVSSAVASHLAYRDDRRAFVESVTSDIAQIGTGDYK